MCKKLICLVSFVLVLGVAAGVTNADIIGYWPFDEGTGDAAHDVIGNHDGQFTGTPTWISPGQLGAGALEVDGSNYVNCGTGITTAPDMTLALWINADDLGHQRPLACSADDYSEDPGWIFMLRAEGFVWFRINGTGGGWADGDLQIDEIVYEANTWVHMAFTFDSVTRDINGYINGELRGTDTVVEGRSVANTVNDLRFGNAGGEIYSGALDEIAIWDHALTPDEVLAVYTLGPLALDPRKAGKPNPDDEATDVPRDVVLSWTLGEYAPPVNGHTVYLSESFNNVNDAVGGVAQDANSYTPAQRLDFNTTYYWRVDEVNAPPTSTVFEGNVWSFTTEPIAYPVENITATASSVHQADTGPENSINGSGLDANDLHSMEPTDMWLSFDEPNGAWIEYELDKVCKLHEMWVWNHNATMESVLGFGLKDVTIEYSTNGTNYTPLGSTHEFVRAPGLDDYAHNTIVDFGGATAKYVRLTTNRNWGSVLDQYGLSEVRFFSIPVFAREPSPDSGTTDVAVDVTLGFRAGREAAEHNVYLSTDEQAVIDGNAPVSTVTEASYGPLSLDLDTTYYWKINEVNEAETTTTWQGEIWNFTTPGYLVVDDFESYNDIDPPDPESHTIFGSWSDGYLTPTTNGALIGYDPAQPPSDPSYMEQTIVYDGYGGRQSMPFSYDNTTAGYSEATVNVADLQVGQDWSKHGIQSLTLYFRGKSDNVTGQLYLKINNTKINYSGATTDIKLGRWCAWTIDLSSVTIVNELTIGIEGGSGMIYVDDIVLYGDSVISTGPLFSSLVQNFDDLAVGSSLHDVDGWEGWDGDAGAGAKVTDVVAYSGSNSLEIAGDRDDLVPYWRRQTDGKWTLTVMQYVPTDSVGTMDFGLMSVYNGGTEGLGSIITNCDTSKVSLDDLDPVDLIRNQWTELKAVMDLPNDVCTFYYNGLLLGETACPSSQAVDIWPGDNAGTIVYYDDFRLEAEE